MIAGNIYCLDNVWEDNFEGKDLAKWQIMGFPLGALLPPGNICRIEDGRLVINVTNPACGVILIANMPDWSNYLVQCKLDNINVLGRDSEAKILFRITTDDRTLNGYAYGCGCVGDLGLGFWKYSGNNFVNLPPTHVAQPPSGLWQIEIEGDSFKFLLNGKQVGLGDQVKDSTFSKGKSAIVIFAASMTVDDFYVRNLESSVDFKDKLTTT